MTALPITSIIAAVLGLALVRLSFAVTRHRRRAQQAVGHGTDEGLLRASRAQGNLVEYSPIFLILMALSEENGATGWWLAPLGVVFLAARGMHAYSLLKAEIDPDARGFKARFAWRVRGMATTFACLVLAAGTALVSAIVVLI